MAEDDGQDRLDMAPARAAARFHQIADIEQRLGKLDKKIEEKQDELKALKKRHESTLEELRAAARNEGTLPLFDDLPE